MKSNLLKISALGASILMMAGCAKTISYQEAVDHVTKNFTSSEVKDANVKTVTDVKKSEGLFEELVKVGKTEEDRQAPAGVITVAELVDAAGYVYKLDGSALTMEYSLKGDEMMSFLNEELGAMEELGQIPGMDLNVDGSINASMVTTAEGYPSKNTLSLDLTINMTAKSIPGMEAFSMPEIALTGALSLSLEVTYSY